MVFKFFWDKKSHAPMVLIYSIIHKLINSYNIQFKYWVLIIITLCLSGPSLHSNINWQTRPLWAHLYSFRLIFKCGELFGYCRILQFFPFIWSQGLILTSFPPGKLRGAVPPGSPPNPPLIKTTLYIIKCILLPKPWDTSKNKNV